MNDIELLATMQAASAAPVVTVPPATLARLLVIAGYEGKAAHHEMLMDRRAAVEVTGPNLLDLVREARAKMAPCSVSANRKPR